MQYYAIFIQTYYGQGVSANSKSKFQVQQPQCNTKVTIVNGGPSATNASQPSLRLWQDHAGEDNPE